MAGALARLTIESIAGGGDGVARLDGLAVFVPRTAPGDVVEATVRQFGRLGRGEVAGYVKRAPSRVTPRCRHYDGNRCGGCQLQHLAYEAQLEAKRRIVLDAFQRIGRRAVEVPPVVPSPSPWAYRSRLTLAMRYEGGRWTIGLHAHHDPGRIFQLAECPITDGRVVDAWRQVIAASDELPRARELRGSVRQVGDVTGLVIEGGDAWPAARDFAARCPSLSVFRWRDDRGRARVIVDRRQAVGPEEAFDQVNEPVAALARADLLARALALGPRSVVDAYAGLGVTAGALAAHGVRVTAIELDPEAVSHARRNHPDIAVVEGRVEENLPRALPADVVILNPPRAGVDARVTAAIDAVRPRGVLYMSCDPATLARDLGRLAAWRVSYVCAYDMFPQTAHVEVVCELIPEDA